MVCMEGLALRFGDVLRDESWGDILYEGFLAYVGGWELGLFCVKGRGGGGGVWCLAQDWGSLAGWGQVLSIF